MQNARLDEAQAGIKIAGRNINLRYADDTTIIAESKEELKSLLMKPKGRVKSWLKTQHSRNEDDGTWSHNFMANRREKVERVENFSLLQLKITTDGDWNPIIRRCLLL